MSPRLLRLRAEALARRDGILLLVRRVLRPPASLEARTVHAFEFKCDERSFARALLDRAPQKWVFRCHQQQFCGDFVVVDLSPPEPAERCAWVVDLKRGADVRIGGGGAGVQLIRAAHATAELVERGVLGPTPRWHAVTGDANALLAWFTRRWTRSAVTAAQK